MTRAHPPVVARWPARWPLAVFGLALCMSLCLAWPAAAQTTDRDREALRRAQQALRSAQAQQTELQREKAALAAEKGLLVAEVKRTSEQAGSAQTQARQTKGALANTQKELASTRAEVEKITSEKQQLQARFDAQASQLNDAQRLLAERTQTVSRMSSLLARSTAALSDAERKNAELYAMGLRLQADYRNKTVADVMAQREPFLGLQAVMLENQAEALRTEMAAQRVLPGVAQGSAGGEVAAPGAGR